MFWKICTSPDINNPDLISKSISKLMGLLKFSSNQKLENDIVKDSIENLKKGQAVIQSIEVIREMLASLDTPSESLMNTLIQNDAIRLTIASLKKVKADIKAAAAKNNSQVTEANVNQLLGDKNYNFETHVQKRLNFVYSLFAQMKDKKEIFNAIDAIWDELVENTILDAEVGYFKNWFTPLGTNQVNLELTKEILREFFSNKVKLLLKENRAGGNKNEILSIFTECFLRMNILAKNINPVVVRIEEEQSYTNETKHLLTKSPSKLEGIDDLWKTALEVPDKDMCMNLINFITNLYIRPELDVMDPDDGYSSYLKEFLDFCVEKYNSYDLTTSEGKTASWRILHMMKDVIDKTESRYVTPSLSLSSFYKGKTATITVDNKISNYFSTAKLIDVKVAGNTTIQHIKNAVAKELKRTTWRQVKLLKGYRKTEIPDRYNSRNLRELGISLNDKFVSEYRATPVIKAEPLVLNSDSLSQDPVINPKAIKAFKTIFNIFQVDGKMRPEQLVKMCEAVLDERNLTTEFSQVKETMSKYDKENKGYLSEDDLVAFYRDAAIYKSMAVMQNLKMLNFNDQLVLNDPSKVFEPKPEFLARDYLLESKSDFVLKLREATEHVPELQEEAWQVLSRLPPIPHVIKQILNLEGVKGVEKPNWEKIIDCRCPYKALYNLFILDFLLDDSKAEEGEHPLLQGLITVPVDQFKREWKIDFIKSGGYQHLFEVLKSFVEKGVKTEHEVLLFSFIMKAVKTYLLASVTIKNPSIYSNIAFIPTTKVPFTALSGKTTSDKKDEKTHSKTEEDQLKIQLEPKVETGAQPIGPLNEAEAKKTTTTGTTTNATTETAKKEEEKQLETLVEKAEFIAFREALISMGEGGDARVDKIETLRFLVRLCENILQKSEQQHFEELTIVELSLSIIFCFILSDQKLLTDLIVTDNIKLLEENSPSKAAGYSDFVSFFLAGLLAKRGYLYVKMFDNAFKILLREAGSKDIQTILVKVVFENSVKSDLALRDSARHIELAVLLLGSICSEGKDDKILLDKSDINSITDLRNLFFDIFGKIFKVKAASREELYFESELLSGYFKLLEKLLAIEPKLKTEIAVSNPQIVERLFSECLFNSPTGQTETKELICKNYFTRTAGFELLSELCRAEPENLQTLLKCGLKSLSMNLPKVSSWSYTVSQGKRSELGFVGLYNLSCICYMNAMLQQFYMTPTFRYGLLMADDGEAENIVPVEDKKIDVDDNLFHQLQKMFAFLDKSERRDYNPFEFCFSYKDHSGQPVNVMIQQDTKEFLDVFFDKIERSLKPTPFRNILYDVYGGKTINLIECSSCSNLRTSEDIFYNLSLEVKNLKNIGEGIEKFITEDTISDYKCEKCLQKCDVYKRTLIKECPNVLIVHLQRIIFDLDVLMNVKINSWYEFPQKLNLEEYTYSHYMKHHKNRNEKRVDPEDAEEMSTENLGIRGEHSYPMDSQLAPESGPVPSEPSNPEPQPASQPPKPVAPEENFEYNLAGVIVHLGSADVGHYYSYINVNRNDPGRVKM
jgi:ubiquitin carboxyl-terminal hydrolase 34